jgi:hypothetical protein
VIGEVLRPTCAIKMLPSRDPSVWVSAIVGRQVAVRMRHLSLKLPSPDRVFQSHLILFPAGRFCNGRRGGNLISLLADIRQCVIESYQHEPVLSCACSKVSFEPGFRAAATWNKLLLSRNAPSLEFTAVVLLRRETGTAAQCPFLSREPVAQV